ncbi:Phosducin-like protein 3 [Trichoplax sp. H2]|uniref:Phosducin domain-containing protein n=1 Tax=Trichoplax adhaerens TaxID=10228 RepID=B3SA77_TRIAD|nr:hypothetical protein TRIADDRAFT_61162 [Trichoplax adhaerens]EDV20467.1 hypothetical protein TRIADDRAFT_61162 [Trichoplax adhaerens]RDD36943.1 Phosducin-like protein 3 [Trichoplax sp. H2]|eukprot:XP_002117161.1 hypothetical protein TRIADDRAFT_61162 [Trichoplax adhaerens]
MQDPNEDTEWNDILRQKGILPPKEEPKEEEVEIAPPDKNVVSPEGKPYQEMNMDELDEFEDDLDEQFFLEYKRKRLLEMQETVKRSQFGDLREISGQDYIQEVTKAGEGINVVLHLYQAGIPLCKLINNHLSTLAQKFPETKFLKSISTTTIPNYPDKNLPTIFVYNNGELKGQLIGPFSFGGMKLTIDSLEWKLAQFKAIKSDLSEDPTAANQIRDVMSDSLRNQNDDDDDGDD